MTAKKIRDAVLLILLWAAFLAALELLWQIMPDPPAGDEPPIIWKGPWLGIGISFITLIGLLALAVWMDFKGFVVPFLVTAGVVSAALGAGVFEVYPSSVWTYKLLNIFNTLAAAVVLLSLFLIAHKHYGKWFLLIIAVIVVVTATSSLWTSFIGPSSFPPKRTERFAWVATVLIPLWVFIRLLFFSEEKSPEAPTQGLSRRQFSADLRQLLKTPWFWIIALFLGRTWLSWQGRLWYTPVADLSSTASQAVYALIVIAVLGGSIGLILWLIKDKRFRLAITLAVVVPSALINLLFLADHLEWVSGRWWAVYPTIVAVGYVLGGLLVVAVVWHAFCPRIRCTTMVLLGLPTLAIQIINSPAATIFAGSCRISYELMLGKAIVYSTWGVIVAIIIGAFVYMWWKAKEPKEWKEATATFAEISEESHA